MMMVMMMIMPKMTIHKMGIRERGSGKFSIRRQQDNDNDDDNYDDSVGLR